MQKDLKFTVTYGKDTFAFEQGSKAYIFHTGVYNDIDKKYGIKGLLEYVSYVFDCYLSDSNHTPLDALADYIARNWEKLKNKNCHDLLDEFYTKGEY